VLNNSALIKTFTTNLA